MVEMVHPPCPQILSIPGYPGYPGMVEMVLSPDTKYPRIPWDGGDGKYPRIPGMLEMVLLPYGKPCVTKINPDVDCSTPV